MNTNQFNNIQDPIARAEAMRAQAIADMLTDMITGVASLVKSAAAKLTAYIEYRRTFDVLAGMTDRELEDIGISRGDIPAVARGVDPRPPRTQVPGGAGQGRGRRASCQRQPSGRCCLRPCCFRRPGTGCRLRVLRPRADFPGVTHAGEGLPKDAARGPRIARPFVVSGLWGAAQ